MVGTITSIDEYMPEHYSYFRGSRKVDLIQFELRKFRKEFKTESLLLQTLKDKGI